VNIQEYISSGIVESYVLGLASDEERSEFEQLCEKHSELLAARTAFELSLENQAMQNAIAPSADVKMKIFEEIGIGAKVISMQQPEKASVKNINWLKYAAAACMLLLAGSVYWNIMLSNKNKQLQDNYDNAIARLTDMEKDAEVFAKPGIKMATMNGTDLFPKSTATVYWDTTSHDVYLIAKNLPLPASDKQYQLWAIFNGQPVDLGVFDVKKEKLLIQAKNAQGAEAFAITLEKKGRADASKPGGDMVVLGKL
jgi:anti-sigma-K factor RskA